MKRIILFTLMIACLGAFGQKDDYGNYFNISKFNPAPKGNGTTDDRLVFLKALQAHKSIFIPYTEKGYRIEGNLNVPAGCRLIFDIGARLVGPGTLVANDVEIYGYDPVEITMTGVARYMDRNDPLPIDIGTVTDSLFTIFSTNYAEFYLSCEHADSVHIVIPNNDDVLFPLGTRITFEQAGAGPVSIWGDDGVTINSYGTKQTPGQYAVIWIVQTEPDLWTLIGSEK